MKRIAYGPQGDIENQGVELDINNLPSQELVRTASLLNSLVSRVRSMGKTPSATETSKSEVQGDLFKDHKSGTDSETSDSSSESGKEGRLPTRSHSYISGISCRNRSPERSFDSRRGRSRSPRKLHNSNRENGRIPLHSPNSNRAQSGTPIHSPNSNLCHSRFSVHSPGRTFYSQRGRSRTSVMHRDDSYQGNSRTAVKSPFPPDSSHNDSRIRVLSPDSSLERNENNIHRDRRTLVAPSPLHPDRLHTLSGNCDVNSSKESSPAFDEKESHFGCFPHGEFWTTIGIAATWAGVCFAAVTRTSDKFVTVDNPIYLDPNFEEIYQVGMVNLRLCLNETHTGMTGCAMHELRTDDVNDTMFQIARSVAFMSLLFGSFMSIFFTASISWRSINLRPVGVGYLIAYFLQSFTFLLFDTELCAKHICRLSQGAYFSLAASFFWILACIAASRMDAYKYKQKRLRQKALRRKYSQRLEKKARKYSRGVSDVTSTTDSSSVRSTKDHSLTKEVQVIRGIQDTDMAAAEAWRVRSVSPIKSQRVSPSPTRHSSPRHDGQLALTRHSSQQERTLPPTRYSSPRRERPPMPPAMPKDPTRFSETMPPVQRERQMQTSRHPSIPRSSRSRSTSRRPDPEPPHLKPATQTRGRRHESSSPVRQSRRLHTSQPPVQKSQREYSHDASQPIPVRASRQENSQNNSKLSSPVRQSRRQYNHNAYDSSNAVRISLRDYSHNVNASHSPVRESRRGYPQSSSKSRRGVESSPARQSHRENFHISVSVRGSSSNYQYLDD